ncbi:hypothetical protein CHS0354_019693 [Potamilus streckersoni]|uniref:Uncharacterized protein n=1 Tax=Potamilus streckersoni TaxID=2493646 RepID=A0AAE0S9I7_9BIVA|nr:hypothetical protein CHS0354_019693 [Potamilus streckersoni]
MEINVVSILGTITVMLLVAEALTLPVDIPQANGEQDANMAEDKRPKYMDTRDLSAFKDLVLYTMENVRTMFLMCMTQFKNYILKTIKLKG